jgi:hypothetical protein
VVLDTAIKENQNDVVAAVAERARTQTAMSVPSAEGTRQLLPPVPVAARREGRTVAGIGPTCVLRDLVENVAGCDGVWLTWAKHRDRLVRIVVTRSETFVTEVPYPADQLADLDDAVAFPAESFGSFAAYRSNMFRVVTGPLLHDVETAQALLKLGADEMAAWNLTWAMLVGFGVGCGVD